MFTSTAPGDKHSYSLTSLPTDLEGHQGLDLTSAPQLPHLQTSRNACRSFVTSLTLLCHYTGFPAKPQCPLFRKVSNPFLFLMCKLSPHYKFFPPNPQNYKTRQASFGQRHQAPFGPSAIGAPASAQVGVLLSSWALGLTAPSPCQFLRGCLGRWVGDTHVPSAGCWPGF